MERLDRIEKLMEELSVSQKETEAIVKANAIAQAKTEQTLERMGVLVGNIGNNNGEFTEEYFYNALCDEKIFAGIKFDFVEKNIHQKSKRLQDEWDIVMYNGNSIALIECKYKAHEKDITKLVTSKVANFRELNPDFASYKIYCGIASCSYYQELEDKAKELGVAILKQKSGILEINSENMVVY